MSIDYWCKWMCTYLVPQERGAGYEADNKDKKGGGNNGEQTSQAGVHTFKGI